MKYIPAAMFLALVALVAVVVASRPARSEQLLVNPGFEDGPNGWTSIDAEISASPQARTGSGALLLTSPEFESSPDVFQWVDVQAASVYAFSGWLLMDDPEISHAFLRIIWFDASHNQILVDDSGWLVGRSDSYRKITMTPRTAPPGAARARVAAVAVAEGAMSMLLDDFAFDRVSAPTPTVSPLPTPTAPPTPAAETDTATATASAPPPTPTVAPTQSPAPAPTGSQPSPTWTPAPQTATPRPTPPEPAVFPSITNTGFEQVSGDGMAPYAWRKIGGEISSVFEPVRSGQRAIALRSESASTKWIYQTVSVSGAQFYQFSAWAYKNDPAVSALFLRISWYESDDGSGEALSSVDSLALLETDSREFRKLDTGPVQAPASARTARLRLMLRPAGSGPGQGYFDDAAFVLSPAPTPTAAPSATASPGAATATHSPSFAPTPTPASSPSTTPAPTPSAAPEPPSPAPTPVPTPPPEPDVFPVLVNGGFEEARDDGTPYGWHKNGGTFAVGATAVAGGDQSLEFYSATTSTKWVYQSVSVTGGAYYGASAWALDDSPAIGEVLIRISWYASEDGSGEALSSDDSAALTGDSTDYRRLDTGPVRAPSGARSARVRLLVRPVSSAAAVAYFDDVAFEPVEAPSAAADGEPGPSAAASRTAESSPAPVVGGVSVTPDAGQPRPAIALANVKPAQADAAPALAGAGEEPGLLEDIVLALVIGIPAVGLAAMFSYDLSRPRGR